MKQLVSLMLLVIVWTGTVEKNTFRIVERGNVYLVEQQLINIDAEGKETQFWTEVFDGHWNCEDVWKQAVIDLHKRSLKAPAPSKSDVRRIRRFLVRG